MTKVEPGLSGPDSTLFFQPNSAKLFRISREKVLLLNLNIFYILYLSNKYLKVFLIWLLIK